MIVSLTRHTPHPVAAIEAAASNSYGSEITKPGNIMKYCYSSGHHSVLEFAEFTFHIEGISRACLAQLTRYRLASYNVRSQRFCQESGADYIIPPSIAKDEDLLKDYHAVQAIIATAYNALLALDVPTEDARYVLSNATATTLEMKMNLRELVHFCNQRLCTRSQWEIRELAAKIRDLVLEVMPEAKTFLVPQCERNTRLPYCTEAMSCGRHPRLKDLYKTKEWI